MRKLNVLHLINNLNVSGATTLLLDVASHVRQHPAESGFRPSTICTLETNNPMAGALRSAGAEVVSPERKLGLASGTRWLCKVIRQTRPDIVHTHLLPATQVGLAAGKLTRTPVVTTVHFTFERLGRNKLLRQMNRASFRLYKRIFAISDAVKQSILNNCHVPAERIAVLRSGVDLARTAQRDPELRARTRQRLGIEDNELVIGSIGRLEKIKGHALLLSALAQLRSADLPPIRLVLVGDGTEKEDLEQKVVQHRMSHRVIFAGTQKNTAAFLASFDIFVLPSLFEGLGLSIIEAMGAGLPVIGSTAGGITEIVSHEESGLLFKLGSSEELAHCLERLIRSPELRRRLAAAGKAKVEQQFAIEHYVERLYAEYASVLANAPSPALEGAAR